MAKRYKSSAMEALHETMTDLRRAGAIDAVTMRRFDETCLQGVSSARRATILKRQLAFQLFKDAANAWRWRLVAANGTVIASSVDGFKRKKDCLSAIELVRHAAEADLVS
jgi:uncharacterized protein